MEKLLLRKGWLWKSSHSQLSIENIKIALKTGVEFYVNSDAHTPEDVGNMEEGINRIKEAGAPINRIKNIIY